MWPGTGMGGEASGLQILDMCVCLVLVVLFNNVLYTVFKSPLPPPYLIK